MLGVPEGNMLFLSWYHIIHLLRGGYYNLNMFSMFSARVKHMTPQVSNFILGSLEDIDKHIEVVD